MSGVDPNESHVGRRQPASGVLETPDGRTILFCTVCTKDRAAWLTDEAVANTLSNLWRQEARDWIVGRWLLMPDHAHFFCTPSREGCHSVERWTEFWKDRLAKSLHLGPGRWQRGLFHRRIRSEEHYVEKREYLRQNPVRAGLVGQPDEWPWQGEIERIDWR
jgi:putative transposase